MKNDRMKVPLSIVTVNYNNYDGLLKTIESILSQTFHDFEWIVIDGGSTDGSKELLKKHSSEFYFCISEQDGGVYNAMNKGLEHVNGTYVNFMNSGDTYNSNETLANVFQQHLVGDIVYGDWIEAYENQYKLVNAPKGGMNVLIYFTNLCHQALFVRSSILQENGYDESYQILADWKRWREFACEGHKFQYIPLTICNYDCTNGKSKENSSLNNNEYYRIFHDNYLPSELLDFINEYYMKCGELNKFHESILTKDIFLLSERSIIRKIMHFNVIFIRKLAKFVNYITYKFNQK